MPPKKGGGRRKKADKDTAPPASVEEQAAEAAAAAAVMAEATTPKSEDASAAVAVMPGVASHLEPPDSTTYLTDLVEYLVEMIFIDRNGRQKYYDSLRVRPVLNILMRRRILVAVLLCVSLASLFDFYRKFTVFIRRIRWSLVVSMVASVWQNCSKMLVRNVPIWTPKRYRRPNLRQGKRESKLP